MMDPSKRIFVNTIAQYTKSFINVCLSLYTVPLILKALGDSDYGIYSLIAGVVALLAFVTNALVVTTQRNISFCLGVGDRERTRRMFSNSVLLHLAVGALLSIVIIAVKVPVMSLLVIEDSRMDVAMTVYVMSLLMLFVSFITAPFKALLIAHENIVFISVIEVLDGVLKLVLTLILLDMDVDRLLIYSYMMIGVFSFEFLVYTLYSVFKYEECRILKIFSDFDKESLKTLGDFAGWTTLGMGVIVGRNQGLSILFNRLFGTVINAAYGIATHLYAAVSFISSSVLNAMNPQIMQAEGQSDRKKMIELSEKESKLVVGLMSLCFVPLIVEMDGVLDAWLRGDVPPYTVLFCKCLLWGFIFDQSTFGLHTANQATGQIRDYTIIMYTPKLLFLGVAWAILKFYGSVQIVMYSYIGLELVMALVRLPYMHKTVGIDTGHFIRYVFLRIIPLILLLLVVTGLLKWCIDMNLRFLVTIPLSVIIGVIYSWFFVLDKDERRGLLRMLGKNRE